MIIVPVLDTLFSYIIALLITFSVIHKWDVNLCADTLFPTFAGLHELDHYIQYLDKVKAIHFKH